MRGLQSRDRFIGSLNRRPPTPDHDGNSTVLSSRRRRRGPSPSARHSNCRRKKKGGRRRRRRRRTTTGRIRGRMSPLGFSRMLKNESEMASGFRLQEERAERFSRSLYHLAPDAIVIFDVFQKKTAATPKSVIAD